MCKTVSVIIPVYNVETYIQECLDSVVNQTYPKLQIILIDDGSTDNSGKICELYAKKDKRITVVHQENKGAGAAKNTGLELVLGEYISLIDGDDYLELNFYETLVSKLKLHDADVVQCSFNNVFVTNKYSRHFNFSSKNDRTLNSGKFLFELLYDWKYAIFWNKLFNSSLLKGIRFPVGRRIDDEFFTYKLICNADKIVNINDCLYNYRMRSTSVMNDNAKEKLLQDRIDCFERRLIYISERFPELKEEYYYHLSNYLVYYKNLEEYAYCRDLLNKCILKYPMKEQSFFKRVLRRLKTHNLSAETENNTGVYFK